MTLQAILAIILLNSIRKSFKGTAAFQQWNRYLWAGIGFFVLIIAADIFLDEIDYIVEWGAHFLLAVLLYLVFTRKDFAGAKSLFFAFLPLWAVNFIGDVVELAAVEFYSEWENYFGIAGLIAFVWMISVIIFTNRQKKALAKERLKAEEKEKEYLITAKIKAELEVEVMERTAELVRQKEELQNALTELKTTQSQLVQSEKMASLGELTAGIAHEIQNPLNFVNNFSDVSMELLEEMNDERRKTKDERDEELIDEIASDIKQNLEKIAHHGRRADSIVKGMLQHSRKSSGEKELTDINALADEYLRLAYHGLRAKDKSFNSELVVDLDENLPKISVLPQDLGRVFLNLFTNAFYAIQQRKLVKNDDSYRPIVELKTQRIGDFVEIVVKDNGTGIPEAIKDKILQPFFTTKPTGEGTGLGLSLSYDIVVKVHQGSINIDSVEGEYTIFTVRLPIDTINPE
ncbi:sensor histidine kinase [Flavobacterium silvaticum]|uniref:histidine kinase n=1 Tax=Flavobacterium silvaticum TaxID=1852020 RepID=A0A972JHV2_9FLAO|nr:ATP-binding protein [Flavobacterium silvaticum]NMH26637.1 histidine kinase [Flavobacterium silvaticum]